MQRPSWLLPWWEAYQASHKLHVLVGYRGDQVCALFPLAEAHSTLTGKSLVFMGSGKVCSDDLGILVEDSDSEETAAAFASWLVSHESCHWDHLNLDGIRENNLAMSHFGRSLESLSGLRIDHKSSPNCWSASLAGGLEAYKSRLTKRARKIVRDAEAAIESGKGRFEIATTQDQAMGFASDIERLHQARWRERGIDGCFTTDEFSNFLRAAVSRMWDDPWEPTLKASSEYSEGLQDADRQRMLVGIVRIGGNVAAGAFCFRDRDAMDMYLVGMNPEYAEERPGWMLNTCFIKHAIGLGCERFDFMRGDEEYKERLGGIPTVQHRWLVPSNRLSSQMRNIAYRAAVTVKDWWSHKATDQT